MTDFTATPTACGRNANDKPEVNTTIALPAALQQYADDGGTLELRVSTYKLGTDIVTRASTVTATPSGAIVYRFGTDWRTLLASVTAKGTTKAIAAQHGAALAQLRQDFDRYLAAIEARLADRLGA